MKQIYNELVRRRYDEKGNKRVRALGGVSYGGKTGEVGQVKKGYHKPSDQPHPQWKSDRTAHHYPRLTAPRHPSDTSSFNFTMGTPQAVAQPQAAAPIDPAVKVV